MNASNYRCSEGYAPFRAWNPTADAPHSRRGDCRALIVSAAIGIGGVVTPASRGKKVWR
jgi:hypothetical protein